MKCSQGKSSVALSCFAHLSAMSFRTSRLCCFKVPSASSGGELNLNSPSESISCSTVKYSGALVRMSLGQCALATKSGPPVMDNA